MRKYCNAQQLFRLGYLLLIIVVLLVLHSCRKGTYQDNIEGVDDQDILQAKNWYENAYPASTGVNNAGKNSTFGSISNAQFDYS